MLTTVHGEIIYFGKASTSITPSSGDTRDVGKRLMEELEDELAERPTETGLSRLLRGRDELL